MACCGTAGGRGAPVSALHNANIQNEEDGGKEAPKTWVGSTRSGSGERTFHLYCLFLLQTSPTRRDEEGWRWGDGDPTPLAPAPCTEVMGDAGQEAEMKKNAALYRNAGAGGRGESRPILRGGNSPRKKT
jgi:hypothetical protein